MALIKHSEKVEEKVIEVSSEDESLMEIILWFRHNDISYCPTDGYYRGYTFNGKKVTEDDILKEFKESRINDK